MCAHQMVKAEISVKNLNFPATEVTYYLAVVREVGWDWLGLFSLVHVESDAIKGFHLGRKSGAEAKAQKISRKVSDESLNIIDG